jgi:hypothetical protein
MRNYLAKEIQGGLPKVNADSLEMILKSDPSQACVSILDLKDTHAYIYHIAIREKPFMGNERFIHMVYPMYNISQYDLQGGHLTYTLENRMENNVHCLGLPDPTTNEPIKVSNKQWTRASKVVVYYKDLAGANQMTLLTGQAAQCVQHFADIFTCKYLCSN